MNKQYDSYMCRPVVTGEFTLNMWDKNGLKLKYGKNGNCTTLDDVIRHMKINKEIIACEDEVCKIQHDFEQRRIHSLHNRSKKQVIQRPEKPEYESQFELLSVALPTVCVLVILMLLILIFV